MLSLFKGDESTPPKSCRNTGGRGATEEVSKCHDHLYLLTDIQFNPNVVEVIVLYTIDLKWLI